VPGEVEQTVRQVEGDIRRRQEKAQFAPRLLEQRKREALEQLREVSALQDALPERAQKQSIIGTAPADRRGATITRS
jgi:hypothetical protein